MAAETRLTTIALAAPTAGADLFDAELIVLLSVGLSACLLLTDDEEVVVAGPFSLLLLLLLSDAVVAAATVSSFARKRAGTEWCVRVKSEVAFRMDLHLQIKCVYVLCVFIRDLKG